MTMLRVILADSLILLGGALVAVGVYVLLGFAVMLIVVGLVVALAGWRLD